MNSSQYAISVENLQKSFGHNEVLKGINLTASRGEVISVLGSSGSGKSTLLRCINLLEIPDGGIVRVSGEEVLMKTRRNGEIQPADMRQVERIRSRLAMVFQQFNLWAHMTILENVMEAPVHVLKHDKVEVRKRAIQYLERLESVTNLMRIRSTYPVASSSVPLSPVPSALSRKLFSLMNPPPLLTQSW
jgi:octopine/nopaline transport system ATP-binding protein